MGGFLLFGVCAYCVLRFIQVPDLPTMILWGAGGGLTAMGFAMIKLWFFMEMQKNSIIWELKRLELRVAGLAVLAAHNGAKGV